MENDVEFYDFITVVYFSITCLSTVGYGDLVAKTNIEKVMSMFFMLVGVGFFSFIGSAAVGWMLRSKLAPGARCALEHGGPYVVDRHLASSAPRKEQRLHAPTPAQRALQAAVEPQRVHSGAGGALCAEE
jgi:hypothetical protein